MVAPIIHRDTENKITRGWFLDQNEKQTFSRYQHNTIDQSISKPLLEPVWSLLVKLMPHHVAPNLLSLFGLLAIVYAYYLCFRYMESFPTIITVTAMGLMCVFQAMDSIDGKHALKTMNNSPLGELFHHACSNIAYIFLALTLCSILDIKKLESQWYIVQIFQVVLLLNHTGAFKSGMLKYRYLSGPNEFIFLFAIAFVIKATIGWEWIRGLFAIYGLPLFSKASYFDTSDSTILFAQLIKYFYYTMVLVLGGSIASLGMKHYSTRNGLMFCLLMRIIPALLINFRLLSEELNPFYIICDGLILSVVVTDVIVCKMAKRELHPWIVVFALISLLNHFALLIVVIFYYLELFYDISEYMQMPMFTICTNVYCDGVFDLLHTGHVNLFKNALKFGNRLFVGVLSDESVLAYKRSPVMTTDERCEAVSQLQLVHKVIKDCPFPGIPEEFLKEHNIHVVCHSVEYDSPDDIYYAVPRKLGMTQVLPRTEGMSTSELIRRCINSCAETKQKESHSLK